MSGNQATKAQITNPIPKKRNTDNSRLTGPRTEAPEAPSIPVAVMLMDGTPPGVVHEPRRYAPVVEPTQALQPRHRDADLELLEADGALRRVDAVLFRRDVGEHARAPRGPGRRGRGPLPVACVRGVRCAAAVRRDAAVDVRFPKRLVVG